MPSVGKLGYESLHQVQGSSAVQLLANGGAAQALHASVAGT